MRRWRITAVVVCAVAGVWGTTLVVLDHVLGPREVSGTQQRLSESLHGDATVGAADLALVRGELELLGLQVRRDDPLGHLSLDIGRVRCALLPLGLALADHTCRELAIHATRLDVSAAALLQIEHPKHAPVHARRVVIDDAELDFSASAFMPNLGAIRVTIDHAEAGHTVLRTPLSWLFALEQLRARLALPGGIVLDLRYAGGTLAVSGTLFGSQPVELPIELPRAAAAGDAKAELALLVEVGKQIAERVVAKRASDWLRSVVH